MRGADNTLRPKPLLAAAAGLTVVLAACGGGTQHPNSSPGTRPPTQTAIAADATDAPRSEPGADAISTPGFDAGAGVWVVQLVDFEFAPAALEVAVDDTVRFVNEDPTRHTATHGEGGFPGSDAAFDINLPTTAREGEFTFEEPGEFLVTCRVHPEMSMTITVVD